MAPSKTIFRAFVRGEADETMPKSRTLRSARDWMPYLTFFFCVVGFTVTVIGYHETLPPSQKLISIGKLNLSRAAQPSNYTCGIVAGYSRFFPVACFEVVPGENEAILVAYAVYYHGLAILGFLQHDVVFMVQYCWSLMGYALNVLLGFGSGKNLLEPILGPEFVFVTILFVLSFFRKGSRCWVVLSRMLGEHKEKPIDVVETKKSDKYAARETFSGIQIV